MGPLVAELERYKGWTAQDLGTCGLYSISMDFIGEHSQVINLLLAAGVPVGPEHNKIFCKLADTQSGVTVTQELEVCGIKEAEQLHVCVCVCLCLYMFVLSAPLSVGVCVDVFVCLSLSLSLCVCVCVCLCISGLCVSRAPVTLHGGVMLRAHCCTVF